MIRRVALTAVALAALQLLVGAQGPGSQSALVDVQAVTASSLDDVPVARTPASAAATWCGTATTQDVTPNVVAGFPLHWLYVIPSDGPDQLATYASVMQTDAEAIDAWWRREDPVRAPRNDLRQLPCGAQLDISSVRLQQTGDELDSEFNFSDIFDGIDAAGFGSSFTKYVVYYDGPMTPDDEGEVCGRGGSLGSGVGLAVVYVRACAGVSTAGVAAHEILHTFDAVPFGAPNDCGGHVCGPENDIMYFAIGGEPLSAKVLDLGRDDYYGHSAVRTDAQDSEWLLWLDLQTSLRVTVTGPGSVAGDVPGLRCAASCTTSWNIGTELFLTATPSGSAKLVRWSGACTGTPRTSFRCSVSTAPERRVGALFAPRAYRLTVAVAGQGSVRTSARGITCRPRCSASFSSYIPVRLTAKPARGWKLRSWSGACRGRKLACTVPMSTVTNARAVFVRA